MPSLNERHRADLAASGLSDETIRLSGCYSASGASAAGFLGFDPGVSLVFPYLHTAENGKPPFRRVKPDEPFVGPDGAVAKYLSPRRELNPGGNRLYVPPNLPKGVLDDVGVSLIVTEGEKKALAGCQEGFPTIGLAGVACWVGKNGDGESQPIADLDLINWKGRRVTIAFDCDATTKPEVHREEKKLAAELSRRGAEVRIARLPTPRPSEDREHGLGGKFGMDDFLKVRGEAAFRDVLKKARPVSAATPAGKKVPTADLAEEFMDDHGYRRGGVLHLRWWRDEFYRFNGTHYEPLPEGDLKAHVNTWLQGDPSRRGAAGTRVTTAIIQNLQAVTHIDYDMEPPVWLGSGPDDREVVSLL